MVFFFPLPVSIPPSVSGGQVWLLSANLSAMLYFKELICVAIVILVIFGYQVEPMEVKSKENNYTVLTPFVSLDTPGKATVRVVILADPVSKTTSKYHFEISCFKCLFNVGNNN